jgi:monoamine oxidase
MFVRAAETKRKVVVVGGGLAGLSCAYEPRKLGFEAIVLEGQGRAGGNNGTVGVLLGNGNGTFQPATTIFTPVHSRLW